MSICTKDVKYRNWNHLEYWQTKILLNLFSLFDLVTDGTKTFFVIFIPIVTQCKSPRANQGRGLLCSLIIHICSCVCHVVEIFAYFPLEMVADDQTRVRSEYHIRLFSIQARFRCSRPEKSKNSYHLEYWCSTTILRPFSVFGLATDRTNSLNIYICSCVYHMVDIFCVLPTGNGGRCSNSTKKPEFQIMIFNLKICALHTHSIYFLHLALCQTMISFSIL